MKEIYSNSSGTGYLDYWVRNKRCHAAKFNPGMEIKKRQRTSVVVTSSLDKQTAKDMIDKMNSLAVNEKNMPLILQLHETTMYTRENTIFAHFNGCVF